MGLIIGILDQGVAAAPVAAARGLFAGGIVSASSNVIDYVTVSTTGNATDFGDLTVARDSLSGCASSTRGIFFPGTGNNTRIDYVTIATTGNATTFGSTSMGSYVNAAVNNSTRGVVAIGQRDTPPTGRSAVIEYITIATTGNTTNFGNLTVPRAALGAVCSTTRGVFIGGLSGTTTMDYITTDTTGNATTFGTLASGIDYVAGASNNTRGIFAANQAARYITIATTGNSDSFGNLTNAGFFYFAGLADSTRALFSTFYDGSTSNVIDYFTIATTGNATDFGDLTVARYAGAGLSSGNGGL
jgi:hypothetical protein